MATSLEIWIFFCLLFGILLCLILGHVIEKYRHAEEIQTVKPLQTAILALIGLLLAFTFSGAMYRFDTRRDLIISEVEAIRSAYYLVDVLKPQHQELLRNHFRQYVVLRIETYKNSSSAKRKKLIQQTHLEQRQFWEQVVAIIHEDPEDSEKTFIKESILPALNEMFKLTNIRIASVAYHEPWVVYQLLAVIVLIAAVMVGYDMRGGKMTDNVIHILGFFIIFVITFCLILDIEFPRHRGFVNLRRYDRPLIELDKEINANQSSLQ